MRAVNAVLLLAAAACLFCAQLSAAAKPPTGSRSLSEQMDGHKNRKNALHAAIPNVVELKADYFDRYIKPKHHKVKTRFWLVIFYSSWCATCDEWIQPLTLLAQKTHEKGLDEHLVQFKQRDLPRGQLSIGKHDVTYSDVVALKYGVEGYPTVMLFDRDDETKVTMYEGDRTYEGILDFVREYTDVKI